MYRCAGVAGLEDCVPYSTIAYVNALATACLFLSSGLNSLLVVRSKDAQPSVAAAGFTTRIVGCVLLSVAMVYVLDSYFSTLRQLEEKAQGSIRTGLVFWSNSVVNITLAVVLLASDIAYRKCTTCDWEWSGVEYTTMGGAVEARTREDGRPR